MTSLDSESGRLEELMSHMHLVLGRVAALRSQLRDLDNDLTEFESGADELLQLLAQAHGCAQRMELPGDGGGPRA